VTGGGCILDPHEEDTAMTTRLGGGFLAVAALCGAGLAAPDEAVTKAEVAGLSALHRHTVKLFIDRAGFGISRMEPPLTDVLNPPASQDDALTDRRPVVENPMAIRAGKDGKAAHFPFTKAVGAFAFIPPPAKGKAWVVKGVQLVGLVKHSDPVVYLTGGAMVKGKDVKTRRPDAFEAKAVEVIRGGGDLVQAEKRGGTLRAVSGIYAGRQCSSCHERPGEMLGAFSYQLTIDDPPAKGVGPRSPFLDLELLAPLRP
jgi:hypothetical protein